MQKAKTIKIELFKKESFMSDTHLKYVYAQLKGQNDNTIPYLTDYLKKNYDFDPCLFKKLKRQTALLYHSYFKFVVSAENESNSPEAARLNELDSNDFFTSFLRLMETILPAKRIEEWCIIKCLADNPKGSVSIDQLKTAIKKYVDYINEKTIIHACKFLRGDFWDSLEHKAFDSIRFNFDDSKISFCTQVQKLFDNKSAVCWINDYIDYAILRYEKEFGKKDYGFPFFKPYANYTMRNCAQLCNYEKMHSSFRGSGLLSNGQGQYFVFVDLNKSEDVKEEFNYSDYFISNTKFHWVSPNNMTQDSERGKDILNSIERNSHVHLFVRKNKEVEGVFQDFIYIGEVCTDSGSIKGNSPVEMIFRIPEVPKKLYTEMISKD